jgi:hypothetical protein
VGTTSLDVLEKNLFLLPGIEALDSPVHGLVTMLTELPWLQT